MGGSAAPNPLEAQPRVHLTWRKRTEARRQTRQKSWRAGMGESAAHQATAVPRDRSCCRHDELTVRSRQEALRQAVLSHSLFEAGLRSSPENPNTQLHRSQEQIGF